MTRKGLWATSLLIAVTLAVFGALWALGADPHADDPGARPPPELLTPEMLAEGRRVFDIRCSPCHGDAGRGGIGPRLTDSRTLHGPRYADMVRVVTEGVESTGMPSWETKLGPERIAIVAAYVFSLWGTKPDDPPSSDPDRRRKLRQGLMVWMPVAWGWGR